MCVFIKGKIVVTDTKIYEFADHSLAEKFINCLVDEDEISSCKKVPAVNITTKPSLVIPFLTVGLRWVRGGSVR